MLMDTLRRLSVTLTNPGKAHVAYSWAWQRQDAAGGAAAGATGPSVGTLEAPEPSSASMKGMASLMLRSGPGGTGSSKAGPLPALFDVMPIRGSLGPGESERVEVSFFGYPGVKASALAVCHVEDGPDYQVRDGARCMARMQCRCEGRARRAALGSRSHLSSS